MNRPAVRRTIRNRLLSSLSAGDLILLRPHLKAVELSRGSVLAAPNSPVRHIYFPASGIVSVVTACERRQQIEIAIIGREGMTGVEFLMGDNRSPHSTVVQSAGQAERIDVAVLRRAIKLRPSLQQSLLHFARVLMIQTAYTALASAEGTMLERLARKLLMVHDRTDGDELSLTHGSLALVLSVQRTGVTLAMKRLEERQLVTIKRGTVIIRDRSGLKAVANGLYGVPEAEYGRLVGRRTRHI